MYTTQMGASFEDIWTVIRRGASDIIDLVRSGSEDYPYQAPPTGTPTQQPVSSLVPWLVGGVLVGVLLFGRKRR